LEVDPLDNLYELAVWRRNTEKFEARPKDIKRGSDEILEFDEMTRAMLEPAHDQVA
jgi:hypothetical protein